LVTDVIEPRIAEFGGQMINWTGERALVEFDSVVEATRYAALLRDCAAQKNEMLRPEQRIALRIGINLTGPKCSIRHCCAQDGSTGKSWSTARTRGGGSRFWLYT
jgi:hypothetical protein